MTATDAAAPVRAGAGGFQASSGRALLETAIAAARADPGPAWHDSVATLGSALLPLLPAGFEGGLDGVTVVTGLHAVRISEGETVWPLDLDPAPQDLVVLGRRELDPGDLQLSWFRAGQLDRRQSAHAPGTGLWGGTEVTDPGAGQPPAAGPAVTGPRASAVADLVAALGAEAVELLLGGAHALGVAGRFHTAFVAKAAITNRGWSQQTLLEDPTTLKALLRAKNSLDAATSLLLRRGLEADAGPADRSEELPAQAGAAGIHAVDAARGAVTSLMSLTGASALYNGNPLQEAALHLGVLGQHPMFSRAARLRVSARLHAVNQEPATEE